MKSEHIYFHDGEPYSEEAMMEILMKEEPVSISELKLDEHHTRTVYAYAADGKEYFVAQDISWTEKELLTPEGVREVREPTLGKKWIVRHVPVPVRDLRTLQERLDAQPEVDWRRYSE